MGKLLSSRYSEYSFRCSALDLASKGVRVNAVNPGFIKTGIFNKAGIPNEVYDAMEEEESKKHPLGRVGIVEEVSSVIGFLASDQASFVTGQTVGIDGGRALY